MKSAKTLPMPKKNLAEDKDLLEKVAIVDTWAWINLQKIKLEFGDYELRGHEYQVDWLQNNFPKQCFKKAAQMTVTTTQILKVVHRMSNNVYKQGVLYLFPTRDDVTDFSKGRFQPIIANNPSIAKHVQDTDAAHIKKVGNSVLYLRGARAAQKIKGIKSTSSQLKSIPVDRVVFDEVDEMSPAMIQLALQRLSHSEFQEEMYISTPSIPEYGVDLSYSESDGRIWMIRCDKCNKDTCLELEFPDCLIETNNGDVIKVCRHCKNEIRPVDGRWVAQFPSKSNDFIGWWISQLNSRYIKPKNILKNFLNPPEGNITEFYNSVLGMAWISSENKLTQAQVLACCSSDPMTPDTRYQTCMGVDVKSDFLHTVIGYRIGEKRYKILYAGRLPDFNAVHDKARDYNVKSAVVDAEPETREVRKFQAAEPYSVYLCDYQERLRTLERRDERQGLITVRRTELCDTSHEMVANRELELPRRNPEIEQYAFEMTNIAKILEEDEETGDKTYKYRKLGSTRPDHFGTQLIILSLHVRM